MGVGVLDHDIDRLRDAAQVARNPHLEFVIALRAHHDHAVAERELGVGDRVVRARHDHVLGEAEGLLEPGDGGGRVAVAEAGNDGGAGLGHGGVLLQVHQQLVAEYIGRGGGRLFFRVRLQNIVRRHRGDVRLRRYGLGLGFGQGALRAQRVGAAGRAEGEERVAREPERLADSRDRVDGFLRERAIGRLDDLDDERAGHGLAVCVEFDRAAEGGVESQRGEGFA